MKKRYGLSAMRWKAEFLKVKHTEDFEKDVVRQNIKHLPCLSRISRRGDRQMADMLERESTRAWEEQKNVFLERCSKTSGADDHDALLSLWQCVMIPALCLSTEKHDKVP